jgi:hypothetical protein
MAVAKTLERLKEKLDAMTDYEFEEAVSKSAWPHLDWGP